MIRTVVLGGTGYIGGELVAALARAHHQVVSVSRSASPAAHAGVPHVETVPCDLSAPGTAARLVRGADVVVHLLAPSDPTRSWRTTGHGTTAQVLTEVLEAAAEQRGAPPLVLVASTVPPADGATHEPSEHEQAKRELEHLLAASGAPTAALLLSTVYGTGRGGTGRGVVASLVRTALRGDPLTVWEGADVERNLLHVSDAAGAFVSAVTAPVQAGQAWSVGGPDHLSVRRLAELVAEEVAVVTGRRVPVTTVPAPPWAVPTDFLDVRVDSTGFAQAAGWHPATTLRAGVADLVSHVRTAA